MGGKKLGDGPSGVALPSGSSLFAGQGDGPPADVDSQASNEKYCKIPVKLWPKEFIRNLGNMLKRNKISKV